MNRVETKAELSVDDAGTITGLAWPFGEADRVGDVIEPGAFRFPSALPILSEHDQRQVIGVWERAEETDAGLVVKGRLFVEGVEPARAARERIRKGIIGGLSISFRHDGFERLPSGERKFSDISVSEISICRRPVHPGARILEVKSEPHQENSMEPEVQTEPETADDNVEVKALGDNVVKLTSRLDQLERRLSRPNLGADNNRRDDADETKAFCAWVRSGGRDLAGLEVKALTETGSGATGGVLVPDGYRASIIEKVKEMSPVRQLAGAEPMSGSLLQLPRLVNEVEPAYVSETGTRTEDEPSFELIDVKPFEMAVIVPISKQLLEDSAVNLAAYIGNHMARQFAAKENTWFVTGNGTSAAEGVLTSTEVGEVETATAGTIKADDLIDLFYSVKSFYSNRGAWLMRRDTIKSIRKLTDSQGNYLWVSGLAGAPGTILGAPVYEAPDMPAVAEEATPIIFGDFASGYLIADRVQYEAAIDVTTGWSTGITKLMARRRVGGRVILGEALTKLTIKAAA